jgi:hypothetical protein
LMNTRGVGPPAAYASSFAASMGEAKLVNKGSPYADTKS